MASASLWFASFAPATSSGVSVGIRRFNCSSDVMRFLSCQRQSFQSESGTLDQNPRPADLNSLYARRCESEPEPSGSSLFAAEDSFFIECERKIGGNVGL